MFTGIIELTGSVKSVEKRGTSGKIKVSADLKGAHLRIGDSIAVNGACLTVTDIGSGSLFTADVSAETLRVTTLGRLKPGAAVNLETAVTPSKPLGGHIVTGHVDAVGVVRHIAASAGYVELDIKVDGATARQIVKKGSVAVDGISLTVTDASADGFKCLIIPHTLKITTIASIKSGEAVNVETDIIGKYVEKFMSKTTGITAGLLAEHGFLK